MRALLGLALGAGGMGGARAQCAMSGGRCLCQDTDGDEWDLTSLKGDHLVTGPGSSIWDFDYHFNFCENVGTVGSTCSFTATAAYRIEDYTGTAPICLNMGPDLSGAGKNTATKINSQVANGVSIKFESGSSSFTVDLRCDETKRGQATEPAEPAYSTTATTEWLTFYTCPAHQAGGGSWGWPALIITAAAAGLYAGGGLAYKYRQDGDVGHPHGEWWQKTASNLPSLVSDGVHFSRCTIADNVKPLAFLAPADAGRGYGGLADDRDGLLAPGDGETSTCARRCHLPCRRVPGRADRGVCVCAGRGAAGRAAGVRAARARAAGAAKASGTRRRRRSSPRSRRRSPATTWRAGRSSA